MFSQVALRGEGDLAEAALRDGFLAVLVVAAHLLDVLLEVRQPAERVAALVTLERAQVVMARAHVHGQGGVVTEGHAAPARREQTRGVTKQISK